MNIVIIEDELKTARALEQLIISVQPGSNIVASIQSVATASRYLAEHARPDLIFMDVQLADGLCFEIFAAVKIVSPVIFCTAYDEYALEAFKSNGIDFILKPFSKESIGAAIEKVINLKNFFQTNEHPMPDLEALLNRISGNTGKQGFLVFKNNKYVTVQTEQIAYFYIRNETSMLVTNQEQEYPLTGTLDDIHAQLKESQFFRINRQYLVGYSAVKEVEHYFARKLFVKLTIPTPDKLIVGKDKASFFLKWLENR